MGGVSPAAKTRLPSSRGIFSGEGERRGFLFSSPPRFPDSMTDFLDTLSQMMSTAREGAEELGDRSAAEAQAAKMTEEERREKAKDLQGQVQACLQELAKVQESLQALSPAQLFGEKGNALKDQADEWVRKLSSLKTQQQVFAPQDPLHK